jgi:hypothetical protein
MKEQNKPKIAYLFRELGEVDDALLQEAITYRPQRVAFPRVWMVAACLAMSFLLSFGAVMIALHTNGWDGPQEQPPFEDASRLLSLDQLLLEQADSGSYTVLQSVNEADFFGGCGYVVWQYADSTELCVSRALSETELSRLTHSVGDGTSVGEQSPTLSCRVWLILGNGEVISPYLKESAGNRGYAELFDYDAELIPSEEFISCVSDILS